MHLIYSMCVPRKKWFNCNVQCANPAILPNYIKNPSLFSGTINNPGSLATEVMRYANRVNRSVLGQKRTTVILSVPKRVIPPLVNKM